ncbi:DNA polymerase III subunit delta [Prosthecochloris sp. GSB1]|uniref:DNA polymerase III subunit delta n=1 Tax=Prosthecochloris sp. GSB1 TaxID=281093 RepID=UPI000B8CA304|nr:DNA polymerase III subunit delta [Prosthecochloris sp. GSB1]ASQ91272.1 DNA polymerase III subunit delta [Prosthecochloris sp. GSB1]
MKKLRKDIASGKISPVYFLHGEESFLKEELTGLLKLHAFPAGEDAAVNTTVLHGPDVTLGDIVSRASEFPMFAQRKLVVVRQFEKHRKPPSKDRQKQHLEQFVRYLANPAETTVLVLDCDRLDKKDLGKPPYRDMDSIRHDFPAIKNPDIFASDRAREQGWEFDPEALKAFSAYMQPSAREIAREIEKVVIYASSRSAEKRITANDVYECVGISKRYNVFELEKALAAKNLRLCSGISLMIMEQEGRKEGLMNILRYLSIFYTRIWKIHAPGLRQRPLPEIARTLGMYGKQEFFAKSYLRYASNFSLEETENAILALQRTDAALKGLEAYPDEKYLLLRLMQDLLSQKEKVKS